MMSASNRAVSPRLPEISDAEWNTRVELAAAYRLMDHFGLGELAHTHICARVPEEPDAFLIKPMELFYDEVTASSLIKYDFQGNPRQPDQQPLSGGGLVIHGGIFEARPDIDATIHSHSTAIIGVSCQQHGLLPINQQAVPFMGKIAYLEYRGLDTDVEQRGRLIEGLQGKNVALLRNHGVLVLGRTVGGVMTDHYKLELACKSQLAALTGGHEVYLIPEDVVERTQAQISGRPFYGDGGLNWRGLLRLADRMFPDHKD
jgi:ribulose-5-phosphate 4-epimerase/fuculose-1-phosphate aldolase